MDIALQPKQQIAFMTEATEVLYGGAAGGGKSVLLRASLIRWCLEVPGIQVYLFRRTLRDLRDNHLRGPMSFFYMLSEMIKTGHAKYRAVENEFSFWNGSVLHLCYCDSENDVENYRGAEMHVLAMDELTHFTEHQYRFLRHRVRIAGMKIPEQYKARLPRIECASNPGSIGHAWVKRTFIAPKQPLELWDTGPEEGGMLRQYIPAKLTDNVHLMTDDPKYADRLRGMGSDHLVRAILDGDWNIVAGQAFEKLRRDVHGLEPFTPGPELQICGSLDWGSSRPFSFGLWCVSDGNPLPNGKTVRRGALIRFDEWYGFTGKPNEGLRLEVAEVADGIKEKLKGRRPAYIIADPSVWKADGGPSHAETMLSRGVILRKGDNSRIAGYLSVRDRISGDEEGPMLYATTNCHNGFWRTMPDIVMDERHVEDVDSDQEDHCFIADTQVSVYNGQQRIGDLVGTTGLVWSGKRIEKYRSCRLTRRGAETITVHFSDGNSVRCTPDHRFMLESGEWCQAKELPGKSVLSYSVPQPKNLKAKTIGSVGTTFNGMGFDFIGPYGRKITDLYRKGSMFITWMKIEATTIQKTLPYWINQAICRFMGNPRNALSIVGCTLSGSDQKQLSGMEVKQVLNGTSNITSSTVQKQCTQKQRSNAQTAKKNLKVGTTQFFAGITARQQREENQASMTLIGSALHAVQHFAQTSTLELKRALLNVLHNSAQKQGVECLRIEKAEPADVYCLTVPSKGMFNLANGIVVSNCYDEVRYMAMSRPWVRTVEKKKEAPDRWMRAFEREDVAANEWKVT